MPIFSESTVREFCTLTGDDNSIHDPGWMRQQGKRPIVPGMLTFLYAAQLAKEHWADGKTSASVYFGDLLHADEGVTFRSLPDGLEVRLSAEVEGKDILEADGRYTQLVRGKKGLPVGGHRSQNMDINRAVIDRFAPLIGTSPEEAAFFYAVACMSQVLLQSARAPQGSGEGAPQRPAGPMPLYHSIHLDFPDGIRYMQDGTLYFCTRPPQEEAGLRGKRYARLSVSCDHDGQVIYAAQACVKLVDPRVLMRALR